MREKLFLKESKVEQSEETKKLSRKQGIKKRKDKNVYMYMYRKICNYTNNQCAVSVTQNSF